MTVDDMWRKNRRDNAGTPCDGVDLNRNCDLLWGVTQGQTSCVAVQRCVLPAPPPSASPRRATSSTCSIRERIDCFADVHSYSELVLLPLGPRPHPDRRPDQRSPALPTGTCAPIGVPGYQEYMTARDLQRFQTVGAPHRRRHQPPFEVASTRDSRASTCTRTTGTHSDYAYGRHIADAEPPQDLRLHL